jgi:hypothetical protein
MGTHPAPPALVTASATISAEEIQKMMILRRIRIVHCKQACEEISEKSSKKSNLEVEGTGQRTEGQTYLRHVEKKYQPREEDEKEEPDHAMESARSAHHPSH